MVKQYYKIPYFEHNLYYPIIEKCEISRDWVKIKTRIEDHEVMTWIKNDQIIDMIEDIEFDGINHDDYPDYCDAYITLATYNGCEMTEGQLEELNEDRDFVYDQLLNYLY